MQQNARFISNGILRALVIIILSAGLLYLIWQIKEIFAYIFIAFALSLMGRPLMNVLHQKLKLRSYVAATLTLIIFLVLIGGFITLTIPLIIKQAQNLSLLNYNELINNVNEQLTQIKQYLISKHLMNKNDVNENIFIPKIDVDIVSGFFGNIFGSMVNILLALFSIIFISFYFLADKNLFNQIILSSVPDKETQKVSVIIQEIKDLLTRYFLGIVLQISCMFIMYLIILFSFGIEDALVIGMICAFLNLIPYIGPTTGLFVISLLSMSSMFVNGLNINTQIIPNIIWIGIFYIITQGVDNFVLQPQIFSKSVKSHPLEIFIVLLAAGILFGVAGVLLAIPGYTVIRVVLKNFFSKYKIVQSITKNI